MEDMLKLDKEKKQEKLKISRNNLKDEILEGKNVSVIFPKMDKQISNDLGKGALAGGMLFGTKGALLGGALGASQQQFTEKTVAGETGTLRIAEKGVVLSTDMETAKIPWNEIEGMKHNIIRMGEGKNIRFDKVSHQSIVSEIINEKASYVTEDGW
ncbi:MAG: hypothetical protein FWH54_00125 [Methanobrevibacter sp.]|nr:hypothetical protein [Methanobrevibacter sp.]